MEAALLSLAFLALAAAAAPAATDWREFDRRRRGVAETPAYYEAEGVRRRGGKVRAWISYEGRLSGLPDPRRVELVELDCARRRGRVLKAMDYRRIHDGRDTRYRLRPARRWTPLAAGSLEEALARHLCPGVGDSLATVP
jgi:hypothetical protein